jgi:hypothetical protein
LVDDLWLVLGTWGGVGIALFAVLWHGWLQRDHNELVKENDKKTLQMRGLNLVFEKLNGKDQRSAREAVNVTYYSYLKTNNKPVEFTIDTYQSHPITDLVKYDPTVKGYVESVRSDLEQIAIMIKYELLDENAYFDAYLGTIVRCYAALHGNIESIRAVSGSKHYTTYFQEQVEERALRYWRDNHPDSRVIYYLNAQAQNT